MTQETTVNTKTFTAERQPADASKIAVRGLWKVFGPDPKKVLKTDLRNKTRKEVQDAAGHVIALRDVTFDVAKGETFVVMGLSGSGKSTLVRCILRLIEPEEGEVLVDGENVLTYNSRRLTRFRRKKAGMVFQRFGLLPHRTVLGNAMFGLEVQGVSRAARVRRAREVLKLVGLEGWEERYPQELSGGMQQRVGLARALAADPEILLMDEPFSALDPLIRREMQAELLRIQEEMHKTIVFITHDLDEALKLGGRIAIMRDGAIIQVGTPEEIIVAPSDEYVGEFTKDVRKAAVLPIRAIMKEPKAKVYAWQGPRVALREMRDAEEGYAFVVDEHESLLGVITLEDLPAAGATGTVTVRAFVKPAPLTLPGDATVEYLLAKALDYDWKLEALPVLDRDGHLVGEVHRTRVRELAQETEPRTVKAAG